MQLRKSVSLQKKAMFDDVNTRSGPRDYGLPYGISCDTVLATRIIQNQNANKTSRYKLIMLCGQWKIIFIKDVNGETVKQETFVFFKKKYGNFNYVTLVTEHEINPGYNFFEVKKTKKTDGG